MNTKHRVDDGLDGQQGATAPTQERNLWNQTFKLSASFSQHPLPDFPQALRLGNEQRWQKYPESLLK